MWQNGVDESRIARTQSGLNQWHNIQGPLPERDRLHHADHSSDGSDESPDRSGTWGERDAGEPNEASALADFEALRRELSNLSRTRSKPDSLARTSTRNRLSLGRTRTQQTHRTSQTDREVDDGSVEAQEVQDDSKSDDDFSLDNFMREGHFEKRKDGRSAKKVGVLYKNLTVKGVGATATFVKTLPDAVLGTFGPDLYRLLCRFIPALRSHQGEQRTLINDFSGVVRDGEMMLVLGKPGSGCSTFLKAIANDRESYAAIAGDVSYGGIPASKQSKMYRGEVNYNPEDDVHFANLSVYKTLLFALLTKTKRSHAGNIPVIVNALLKMFGITHTRDTQVGDEYTRGVSGGERKRVSIAETLASKSTVVCWDNSTRGLDASTALDYAKSLRIMTDISNRTTITTLYQAGEGLYELMDKVLVIDAGRCVFQGPAGDARQYFINLGFHAPERQTTADFLTAVTDPKERQFREGCEASTPKTAEELEQAFRKSEHYQRLQQEIQDYEVYLKDTDLADAKEFEGTVQEGKSKTVPTKSSYTVSFWRQVLACTQREFWLILGDTTTLWTKLFIIVANGLIVGSIFYGQSLDTSGGFTRGGSLFFSILFISWIQLTELMRAVSGRAIVARHRDYAFYRPSAVTAARVLTDFPVILVQVLVFGIIMYFMNNLDLDASKFFIYMLFVYTTTICITSLYRMFAALSPTIDDAVRFSGIALNLLVIYTGYVIPKTQLLGKYIWFGWLYWISPVSYSFEGVLTNEFANRNLTCAPSNLVPQGPGVDPNFQGCAFAGAEVNAQYVNGEAYLNSQYSYSRSNLWRNFAVLIAFTVLYLTVTVVGVEIFNFAKSGGGALVFKRTKKAKQAVKQAAPADEEKATRSNSGDTSSGTLAASREAEKDEEEALDSISGSDSVFTWQDVEYTVPYGNGERKLLNKVSGYAKPGVMVALVGASGAGKTTLLNTLAQRQKTGVISGDMLVDGKPLGIEFQRGTGFCEQMDLHDGTATIREALEFSAILRQDASIPREEKIAYVDKIISLLEMNEIQDAVISSLGVEQRKRLTIGVELAAKPQLLLFLDEPTSGLDSQSAWSIVQFLKRLARAGQAIVCTIHQPSSQLIQQFDMILALNPGGNTFYFGPVGESGNAVIKYFADRGIQCPPNKNVAEFILETAAKRPKGKDGRRINWNEEWVSSAEAKSVLDEINGLKRTRSNAVTTNDDGQSSPGTTEKEFAAPVWLQTTQLTTRLFRQHWRDPSYLYGKLFVSVIVGIFNGFTFYALGNTIQDMQNRMFTSFLIITIPPTIVNAVVPKFYSNMALWMAREHPSRIYGWVAFTTAQVVAEIPISLVSGVLYWALWYWPTGLPRDSETAGYTFIMTVLFFLFQASWGQWICAFAPSFTVISNVLPFFFVMFSLFNGVVRPYAALPVFWRYWMYWINPSTYWIGGVLAATLKGQTVQCGPNEVARFTVPQGQTCGTYAGQFAQSAGGYLVDNQATECEYCPLSNGDQYLSQLNLSAGDRWPYLGVFVLFVFSNWALVYFFIWTVRIKGWTFGMGPLFGTLGKGVDWVKGLFGKGKGKNEGGDA
ncbi:Brefeldin A resistance protein [Sphaceloma murrayae]|uniref:ABC multidrug transporter atrF n=1 Tax=Sphaceloma murrayae TaxID=2082308 RepID=A0A2K1QJL0_9PEZI|nr:Brefeldin A resistance protein [Sphaceloma murrayae]